MKKFIENIIFFLILGLLIGEIIARLFALSSDIPNRMIDKTGIQKYIPNQKGTWKGGSHNWYINEKGWPGHLPKSFDNLVTIIGDSYIENFMNPDECHQSNFLKNSLPKYNYLEASRSGVSFIEAMEISKQLDTLNPKVQLIYVHDTDFFESIVQINKHNDITQLDLHDNKIIYGEMKAPRIKKILYNWKFIYYLYTRFPIDLGKGSEIHETKEPSEIASKKENDFIPLKKLLEYIAVSYKIENKVLVFRPGSDIELINLSRKLGFKILYLKTGEDDNWSFEYDSHWTCYGHEKAALQVAEFLNRKMLK